VLGRIAGGGDLSAQALSRAGTPGAPDDTAQVSPQRPVVTVATPSPNDNGRPSQQRPSVPFLAQLIATAAQMPQTRERRRAEPAEAISSYETTTRPSTEPNGRLLSRST
jgi:hypothetical protein